MTKAHHGLLCHVAGTLQTHRPVNLDIQDFTVADMLPQITANNSDDLTEAATSVLKGNCCYTGNSVSLLLW